MDNYIFDNRLRFNRDGVLCVNGDFYEEDVMSPSKAALMTYQDDDSIRYLTFNEHTVFASIYAHILENVDDDSIHCCGVYYDEIAAENGISVRTVQRVVKKLEQLGLIVRSKKFYDQTLIYLPYHRSIRETLFIPDKVVNSKYSRVKLRKTSSGRNRRSGMSPRLRFDVFQRDNFTCQYCGRKAPDVVLHVDHIVPVANGGTDTIENLTTACRDCNLGKSDRELASSVH